MAGRVKERLDETRFALERLTRLVRAREHSSDLNPAQWETLRYLARANHLSDSPLAVTRYLNATKGTVSQTIIALERKGYVERQPRENERRSIRVVLTDEGRKMLKKDPWSVLDKALSKLKPKLSKSFDRAVDELLQHELSNRTVQGFGICRTCRFFRENGADSQRNGPHQCLLFDAPLRKKDSKKICIEHAPA